MSKAIRTSTPGVFKRGTNYVYVIRADGKQRWVSRSLEGAPFTRQKDAAAARRRALGKIDTGEDVAPDKVTLGDYLTGWLDRQRAQVKPSSLATYKAKVGAYVTPHPINGVMVQKLTSAALTAFYADLHRGGSRDGKALSRGTIGVVHAVLSKALGEAADDRLIPSNPAQRAKLPKHEHREAMELPTTAEEQLNVWDEEQAAAFTKVALVDPIGIGWVLALNTGLRRGEVFGLRWEDVDYDNGVLHVRQALVDVGGRQQFSSPKSGKRRSFRIDPSIIALLTRRRAMQNGEQLACGQQWRNEHGLIFTNAMGGPVLVNHAGRVFRRLSKRAAVPAIRPHDTRHTFASQALADGIDIFVVSRRLGHATISQTLDVYGHLMPDQDDKAAHIIGQRLSRLIA